MDNYYLADKYDVQKVKEACAFFNVFNPFTWKYLFKLRYSAFYIYEAYYRNYEERKKLQEENNNLKTQIDVLKNTKAIPLDEHKIAIASLERSGGEKFALLTKIQNHESKILELEHKNRKLENENKNKQLVLDSLKSENIKLCELKESVNKFIKDVKFKQTIEKEEECNSPF